MNGTTVEHIKDAAPIFGAYFDILAVRTFPSLTDRELDYSEKVFNSFVKYSNIPVVSLESATLHPLQSLADVLTISEYLPVNRKAKVVLQWAPHIKPLPQCVANSFAQWMNDWEDVDLTIAAPAGYELCSEFTGSAQLSNHPTEAIADADFVYVKNWSSYTLYGQMPPVSDDWMLTEAAFMQQNTKVMHCLPVRRNVVLSDEILDGPRSLVQLQAKNRIPAAQAVLSKIIDGLK
jgi:N-succinyl-L-ornithine transcarbamylase